MTILLLCIKIFCFRIIDVSLGTVRTIVTVAGRSLLAAAIGFCEVFIWFIIVRDALTGDTSSIWVAVAYAFGFATGTYIGGKVAKHLLPIKLSVQVITSLNPSEFAKDLKTAGFSYTLINAIGGYNNEERFLMIFEIEGKTYKKLKNIILQYDKKSFITVMEAKNVLNGYFQKDEK